MRMASSDTRFSGLPPRFKRTFQRLRGEAAGQAACARSGIRRRRSGAPLPKIFLTHDVDGHLRPLTPPIATRADSRTAGRTAVDYAEPSEVGLFTPKGRA